MNDIDSNIREMINSSDKDCVYLAVSMLRNNPSSFNYKTNKLLSEVSLFDRIKGYSDVCKDLDVEELTIKHFSFLPKEQRKKALAFHKIQNIVKLFNGDWVINWNNSNQQKWYPWFEKKASGWVFDCSHYDTYASSGEVGFFKDEKTSDFCGKLFIKEYSDYLGK